MINEFGVKNFFGFKEWAVVSFDLDKKVPHNISMGLSVSPILGVKGANASGKTNLLKVLGFIKYFVTENVLENSSPVNSEKDQKIDITSFFKSKDASDFFIDFDFKGINYKYEFSVTVDEIIREELFIRKNVRSLKIFERERNELTYTQQKYKELKKLKLKKNISVIQHIMNFDFRFEKEDILNFNQFFECSHMNVNKFGIHRDYSNDFDLVDFLAQKMVELPGLKDFVVDLIKRSDLGVSSIEVDKNKSSEGEDVYSPYFIHNHDTESHRLPFVAESNGTRKLFVSLSQYWFTLQTGGFLALDEFDIHLHPMILPSIVELFSDCNINKTGAQFIFTSHNSEIMDLLGKYRTVLVEKKNNESYCYRLDEIPGIRGDRSLSGRYLKGEFGGVPDIG